MDVNKYLLITCLALIGYGSCQSYDDQTLDQLTPEELSDKVLRDQFEQFIQTYGKTYDNENEYNQRLENFRHNLGKIYLLNRNEAGDAKYGVNQFADLSEEEFRKNLLGYRSKSVLKKKLSKKWRTHDTFNYTNDLPKSFDWRDKGVVSPVKNQGFCGSCWAFSTTGNIEGINAIKTGKLVELSEQELVDCDKYDEGCNGGLMTNAYKSIIQMGGLETETDYPYDGKNEKCHFDRNKTKVTIDSYVNLPQDETKLAQWLVKNGPISIGINANAMQFYLGGVSHPLKWLCNPSQLDHGVLIVGFGVKRGRFTHKLLPYWIVKNSWGTSWGSKGYYLVYRGDGTCGVNREASSAVINH